MAHNILLRNSVNSDISANVLKYINRFYDLSLDLQKKHFTLLGKDNSVELLELIYKNISTLLETINSLKNIDIEIFNSLDILSSIKQMQISNRLVINCASNFKQEIIANKELIEATILILVLLQLDEHKLKYANIYLDIDRNKNTLDIQIPQYIGFNSTQKDIIYGKESYKYIKREKKFYGLYLVFLKKLLQKCNAKLKIYTKHNSKYKIFVSFPIKLNKTNIAEQNSILSSLNKKVLIYTNSKYAAHKIKEYLSDHQLFIETKVKAKIETKYPNFLNYDLLIVDSLVVNSKVLHMLQVAKNSGIKIVLLADTEKKRDNIEPFVDITINKPFNYNELTFTILNFYAKEPNSKTTPIKSKKKSKKRVIIADDDIANLKLLEFKFKEYNVETYTATNGKELLSLLEKYGADLLIVDSIMPLMDGYEVTKYIRSKNRYRNLPIIIHSSFSFDSHAISDIFHNGFDGYLPKPFSHKDIDKIFKTYLSVKEESKTTKEKKRFYALYKDIDRLIEKYAKENKINSLSSLFANLKKELITIEELSLAKDIDKIEQQLNETTYIDNVLM